ncbi:MAG: caspase family protein [Planctomycetota bacterium]
MSTQRDDSLISRVESAAAKWHSRGIPESVDIDSDVDVTLAALRDGLIDPGSLSASEFERICQSTTSDDRARVLFDSRLNAATPVLEHRDTDSVAASVHTAPKLRLAHPIARRMFLHPNTRRSIMAIAAVLLIGFTTTLITWQSTQPTRPGGEWKTLASLEPPSLPAGAPAMKDLGPLSLLTKSDRSVRRQLTADDVLINDGSYAELHEVTLAQGQRVDIRMTSSAFHPFLMIAARGESGAGILARSTDHSPTESRLTFTAPESATYLIVANSLEAEQFGWYEMTWETSAVDSRLDPVDATSLLDVSEQQLVEGSLGPGDESLDGRFVDRIDIRGRSETLLTVTAASSDFDIQLAFAVVDAAGVDVLAYNDDGLTGTDSELHLEIPRNGRYTLLVTSYTAGESGRYTVQFSPRAATNGAASPAGGWESLYPGGGDPDERYAVLVGIDDYPSGDLGTCVADTRVMHRLLVGQLGYRPENIVVINDHWATSEHVRVAIECHLGQAGPGGTAFFYFSGHGTRVPDNHLPADLRRQVEAELRDASRAGRPVDESTLRRIASQAVGAEPDGLDEAIVVWGSNGYSLIIDDEMRVLLSQLGAERVSAVFDSCHAGTATRAPGEKFLSHVKLMEELSEDFKPASPAASELGSSMHEELLTEPDRHILIASCRADETSLTGPFWDRRGGVASVFTYFFADAVEAAAPYATLAQVVSVARDNIVDHLRGRHNQTPQAEGDLVERPFREVLAIQ